MVTVGVAWGQTQPKSHPPENNKKKKNDPCRGTNAGTGVDTTDRGITTCCAPAIYLFIYLFFSSSGEWGKIKLYVAHHTSTYFHTRRVSSCFRSPTLAGAPFGSHCRYSYYCCGVPSSSTETKQQTHILPWLESRGAGLSKG